MPFTDECCRWPDEGLLRRDIVRPEEPASSTQGQLMQQFDRIGHVVDHPGRTKQIEFRPRAHILAGMP
jgi:hypothetical protein